MSMKTRITSNRITELHPDEIFVFGSNLEGAHGGGAAYLAWKKWGAIWGQGTDCKDRPMVFRLCTENRKPSNLM